MSDETTIVLEAAVPPEPVEIEVVLLVQHRVTVSMTGNSSLSMDAIKELALREYHRNPQYSGKPLGDAWRHIFDNRQNIQVGNERVSIAGLNVKPRDSR